MTQSPYYVMYFILNCSVLKQQDEVAEWLRRWTANPLGSARVGSNPILVDVFYLHICSYEGVYYKSTHSDLIKSVLPSFLTPSPLSFLGLSLHISLPLVTYSTNRG